jgi:hypothetical protein
MNTHESPRHLEDALAYLDALNAQDIDVLAKLWRQAETDPELDQLFCEINQGVMEEEGLRPQWQEYRQAVLGLLQRHLPSALTQEPLPSTLTVGDVATRIASNDRLMTRLAPIDRQANARLQEDRTPLPTELGMKELLQLTARIEVAASSRYWREFQQVAVLAAMSRGQAAAKAAAREVGKHPRSDKQSSRRRKPDDEKGPQP